MSKNLKKIDNQKQDISGGKLISYTDPNNSGHSLYKVTDDKTGEVVLEGLSHKEALKINKLYNNRDKIESRAKNYKKTGEFKPWE